MNRKRLLRFAWESILAETLKGKTLGGEDGGMDDEIPVLPPVTYKAVKGLSQVALRLSLLIQDLDVCERWLFI
jgi:hypothetical protein